MIRAHSQGIWAKISWRTGWIKGKKKTKNRPDWDDVELLYPIYLVAFLWEAPNLILGKVIPTFPFQVEKGPGPCFKPS